MRKNYIYRLVFWVILGWILAAFLMNRFFTIHLVDYAMLYDQTKPNLEILSGNAKGIFWMLFYRVLETLAVVWLCRGEKGRWTIPMLMITAGFLGSTALVLCIWNGRWLGIFTFFKEYFFPSAPFYLLWYVLILHFGIVR